MANYDAATSYDFPLPYNGVVPEEISRLIGGDDAFTEPHWKKVARRKRDLEKIIRDVARSVYGDQPKEDIKAVISESKQIRKEQKKFSQLSEMDDELMQERLAFQQREIDLARRIVALKLQEIKSRKEMDELMDILGVIL